MATPPYLGPSQPVAGSGGGWLGRLGSYFGNGGTPAYQSAPIVKPEVPMHEVMTDEEAQAAPTDSSPMSCPIDPSALAEGHIAIVIPRRGA